MKLAAGFLRPTAPKGQTSVSSGMFIFSSLLAFLGLEDKETSEGAAEEHQQHVYGKKNECKIHTQHMTSLPTFNKLRC